jgi:hypothetical protein
MQQRGQWCSLAAGLEIGLAKVSHGGDSGEVGDALGVTQLDGFGFVPGGVMPDGLAMRANGRHLLGMNTGAVQQTPCREGKKIGQFVIRQGEFIIVRALAAADHDAQHILQFRRVGYT